MMLPRLESAISSGSGSSIGTSSSLLGWFFLAVLLWVDSLVVDAARFRTPESDLILDPVGAAPTHMALRVASDLALRSGCLEVGFSATGFFL
ncbi:hypothetical protein B0H14DRAFT_2922996, partial [Mycena olivaceomarginata]